MPCELSKLAPKIVAAQSCFPFAKTDRTLSLPSPSREVQNFVNIDFSVENNTTPPAVANATPSFHWQIPLIWFIPLYASIDFWISGDISFTFEALMVPVFVPLQKNNSGLPELGKRTKPLGVPAHISPPINTRQFTGPVYPAKRLRSEQPVVRNITARMETMACFKLTAPFIHGCEYFTSFFHPHFNIG